MYQYYGELGGGGGVGWLLNYRSSILFQKSFFIPVVLVQKIVNKKSSKIKYVSNFLKSYLNLLRFFQFTRSSNRSDFSQFVRMIIANFYFLH